MGGRIEREAGRYTGAVTRQRPQYELNQRGKIDYRIPRFVNGRLSHMELYQARVVDSPLKLASLSNTAPPDSFAKLKAKALEEGINLTAISEQQKRKKAEKSAKKTLPSHPVAQPIAIPEATPPKPVGKREKFLAGLLKTKAALEKSNRYKKAVFAAEVNARGQNETETPKALVEAQKRDRDKLIKAITSQIKKPKPEESKAHRWILITLFAIAILGFGLGGGFTGTVDPFTALSKGYEAIGKAVAAFFTGNIHIPSIFGIPAFRV